MKIAFLLYPVSKVKINEDSSFWIMRELIARGHKVFYFESRHLFWQLDGPFAYLSPAKLHSKRGYLPSKPNANADRLSLLDCIFIRKEPPFDTEYLSALQILESIKHKAFILNDPQGMAISNEKLFSLLFKKYTSETFVTQEPREAKKFIHYLKKPVVIKPLDEKGGAGIFSSSPGDRNLPSLLDTATVFGQKTVMIQRFIPADRFGDKRILILDGKPLGSFIRRPPTYDFRANLSIGGSMHRSDLTAWDKKLVEFMAPKLLAHGLYFAGIDVIGKYLTEVNVTSPAGIPEIHYLSGMRLEKDVADFIEKTLAVRKRFLK